MGLPGKFKDECKALRDHYYWLKLCWQEYQIIFRTSEELVEIVNEASAGFFGMTQILMIDNIILGVCRLMDPSSTGSKKNLVLEHFVGVLGRSGDAELSAKLGKRLGDLRVQCQPMRDYRNKRLAHSDYDALMGRWKADPVPAQDIDEALTVIYEFMKEIGFKHEGKTHHMERAFPSERGGAEVLLMRLEHERATRRAERDQQKAWTEALMSATPLPRPVGHGVRGCRWGTSV